MKEHKSTYKPIEKVKLGEVSKERPKKFQQVVCPSCQSAIDIDHVSLPTEMGKCGSCQVIFSISEEIQGLKKKEEKRQEFLRPEGIDLFFFKEEMDITIDDQMGLGLQLLHIMLHFGALAAIGVYFFGEHPVTPIIPLAFILSSIILAYIAITYAKRHKIFIDINQNELNIKSRPKNHLKKDKTYLAADIDQLYLKSDPNGTGHIVIYAIVNSIDGQKHEKLCMVNNISKAKYLEQEIENYLGLNDRKVPESNV